MPVRVRDGGSRILSLTELPSADDALDVAWPRPDFNAAAMELLIGIASLALQPSTDDAWAGIWHHGPEDWEYHLHAIAPAFELLGDGPRFLQEFGGLTGEEVPVEDLIVDTSGENARNLNKDLLAHRGRYSELGLPTAAIALYTLQAFAGSGGPGFLTSLRGGGPLSTILVPVPEEQDPEPSLWKKVWANVLPVATPVNDVASVCAWMRPGFPASKIHESDPSFHKLHAFFGMPRRIWLIVGQGSCAMTEAEGFVIRSFVRKQKGHDYGKWIHPLSPYLFDPKSGDPISVKAQSSRLRAADWIKAAVGEPPLLRQASVVQLLPQRIEDICAPGSGHMPVLRVGGWNMDKATATDWLGAEEPLYVTGDVERNEALAQFGRVLAHAADEAAGYAASAAKRALFGDGPADTAKGGLATVRTEVLDAADAQFHDHMARALHGEDHGRLKADWLRILRSAALTAFDSAAPVRVDDPQKAIRIVSARRNLIAAFGEKSKAKRIRELTAQGE